MHRVSGKRSFVCSFFFSVCVCVCEPSIASLLAAEHPLPAPHFAMLTGYISILSLAEVIRGASSSMGWGFLCAPNGQNELIGRVR